MIKLIRLSVLPAALVLWVGALQAQSPRIGYINSQRILSEAPGARQAQQQFEDDLAGYRSEIERLEGELRQEEQELQQQRQTLSEGSLQERAQSLQEKFISYQRRVNDLETTAQQRQAELVEPIMRRISEVIEEMREEGGYDLIFDVAGGGLISADPSLDLSGQVLERLRAEAGD
ncbi:MAG: OmpH family outer membrane protein [Longimicrobiaceae bacterium]